MSYLLLTESLCRFMYHAPCGRNSVQPYLFSKYNLPLVHQRSTGTKLLPYLSSLQTFSVSPPDNYTDLNIYTGLFLWRILPYRFTLRQSSHKMCIINKIVHSSANALATAQLCHLSVLLMQFYLLPLTDTYIHDLNQLMSFLCIQESCAEIFYVNFRQA